MKMKELRRLAQAIPDPQAPDALQRMQACIRQLGLDPNQIYQELEMTSRLVDTHRDTSWSNAQVQLHSHTFYELLYCCNSCGAEYLVGAERYRLEAGDIIFVPPGVSHRPLLPEKMDEPYSRYILWLSQEFMDWFAGLYSDPLTEKQARTNMLRTGGTRWERLGELFADGVKEAERQDDGWEVAVLGNTVTLLIQIKRATADHSARAMKAEEPVLLDRIAAYVEENYCRRMMISDLAREFYMSESTISHLFKQKMGVSFYHYTVQRRLIAAKTLIESGALLEDVAVQTGFGDYSGFYRAFKQEYGISPRQYRKLKEAQDAGGK